MQSVLTEAARAGARQLLVVSTEHRFWQKLRPAMQILGNPKSCGHNVLTPWSHGVNIRGWQAACPMRPQIPFPQPSHFSSLLRL